MRSFIKLAVACSGMLFGGVAWAATVVIDFNSMPRGTFVTRLEDGFVINAALAPSLPAIDTVPQGNGTQSMMFCGYCQDGSEGVSIYSQTGLTFELDSLDVFTIGIPAAQDFQGGGLVTGYLQGGGTITQSFNATVGIKPVLFGSSWINLTSVDIVFDTSSSFTEFVLPSIDNITLQVVPVPAALWLFAFALGVLGWRHRRIS